MKTSWDLENLYYKGLDDPRIEEDVKAFEDFEEEFAKKYKDATDYLEDPKALKEVLDMLEEKEATGMYHRPLYHLHYVRDIDAHNEKAQALEARLSDRYTKAGAKTIFFELNLSRVSKEVQKRFLESDELLPYRYYLERLFESAKYALSLEEETLLSRTNDVAAGRWVNMTETIEAKKTITHEGNEIPLPEALERYTQFGKDARRSAWKEIKKELIGMGEMAAHELNAIISNYRTILELRGYAAPEEPTLRGNENEKEVIDELAKVVTDAFPISHEFYKTKGEIVGYPLRYEDREVDIGEFSTKFSFEESAQIIMDAVGELSPTYKDIFHTFLENGHIDAFPKKGKRGGAYSSGGVGKPTFMFLNHVDTVRSFETFAHELGHSIHTERAKEQLPTYQGYSTAVAETASTFFEQVAREKLMQKLPEDEKFLLKYTALKGSIATIFRQIAAFNFERELHAKIKEEGFLQDKEIAALLAKHLRLQLGSSVQVEDDDGYSYVYWSHFRNYFYVYTYAYGELVSKALFARYKKDPSYIESIDRFMARGSSLPAEKIFEEAGLSFKNGEVFKEGIAQLRKELDEFVEEAKQRTV